MPNVPLLSFNTGEITPLIDARSDLEKYSAGCRTLVNMIPRIYGGVERRPGAEYIQDAKNSPESARMIPFIFSSTIAYMLEFGDLYIRVYFDGVALNDTAGNQIEITTPYVLADLDGLHVAQIGDTMWLVHPNYAPRKLTRTTTTTFSLDTITFTKGPFQKRNDLDAADSKTMTSSVTTGTGTLTASAAHFTSDHVNGIFSLTHPRTDVLVSQSGAGTSSTIDVLGDATWTTRGTWTGTVKLERNENSGGWETFRVQTSTDDANIQFSWTEKEDNVQYRITVVAGVTGTVNSDINVHASTQEGIVRVDSFTSSTVVNITVLANVSTTDSTIRWAEGSWSDDAGWPGAFTFFENRAVYAGTDDQPQTEWLSETDDFEDFRVGTNAADAFSVTIQSTNRIVGLAALEALVIFTTGDEWRMQSNKLDTPITPTNFSAKQQTEFGASTVQPVTIGPVVMFLDEVGRKMREFTFSEQRGKHVAPDMTALAEHITQSGIVSFAYQKNPDSILWGIRADGTLTSMVYDREQNTIAWSRHIIADQNIDTTGNNWDLVQYTADPGLTQTTAITNVTELQAMKDTLGGNFYLANDIDASATKDWNNGAGFEPIGVSGSSFTGTLEGNGFTITGLYMDSSQFVADLGRTNNHVGLFGHTTGATVNNLTIKDMVIEGDGGFVGFCVGNATSSSVFQQVVVKDCAVLSSGSQVGGFVGTGSGVTITLCRTENVEMGGDGASCGLFNGTCGGGFVDCTANGTITQSAVAGGRRVSLGGFVGQPGATDTYTRCHCTGVSPLNRTSLDNSAHDDGTYGGFVGTHTAGAAYTDCTYQDTMNHLPVNGEDETQTVAFTNPDPSAGTYTLSFDGTTTGAIAFDATAATIQTAFDDAFGAKVLEVENTPISTMEVWFRGKDYTRTDVAIMTMDSSGLTGFNGVTIAEANAAVYSPPGTVPTSRVSSDTGSEVRDVITQTGTIKSIAVIPGRPGTNEEEVWATIRLLINSEPKTFIVRFKPRDYGTDLNDAFFVDCGLTVINSPASVTITGLDHLDGETVKVLGDGTEFTPTAAVSSGSITITTAVVKAQVGLANRFILKPIKPVIIGAGGTTFGSKTKVAEMVVSFYRSFGAQFGVDTDNLFEIDWTAEEYENNTDITGLFTGEIPVTVDGGFNRDVDLVISDDGAMPCVVRAIVPRLEKTGR